MKYAFLFSAILIGFVCGCMKKTITEMEKSEVVGVWKHEMGEYSVTILQGNELVDKDFPIHNHSSSVDTVLGVKLIVDVPPEKKIWYEASRYPSCGGYEWVKIHIHSIEDIQGSGWKKRTGKYIRKGATEAVELEKQ